MAGEVYTVRVHHEPGEELWAEVLELPGCFAAGADMGELREALSEAISLYLSEPGDVKHVELEDEPGSAATVLACSHLSLARWPDGVSSDLLDVGCALGLTWAGRPASRLAGPPPAGDHVDRDQAERDAPGNGTRTVVRRWRPSMRR
jgi:predicted RNase H-like HicB family nuclease